jgi:hypothetical protein
MDGNLAMNSQFENMSEKDSNDMADHYITLEGNELIARFMGYIQEETVDEGWLMWKRNKEDAISFRTLTFDRNWSELMPVVEKIGQTHNIRIQVSICSITMRYFDRKQYMKKHNVSFDEVPPIAECNESTFIGNVWHCVAGFIKWYNTQNPQQDGKQ